MDSETYKKLAKRLMDDEWQIQETKGKEYRHDDDVLANFKRLGQMLDVHPAVVCMIYMFKHIDSLISFIKGGMNEEGLSEPIEGRIMDTRNYEMLLNAIFVEEREKRMLDKKENKEIVSVEGDAVLKRVMKRQRVTEYDIPRGV